MKKVMLCFLISLLLVSCRDTPNNYSNASLFYYKDSNKDTIVDVSYTLSEGSLEKKVESALEKLYTPEDDDYFSVFPSAVRHTSFDISENICTVNLAPRYLSLPATSRVAIDAALTKTLCSINGINSVNVICEDYTKTYTNSDVVLSSPKIYNSTQAVNLYFSNATYTSLKKLSKNIYIQPNNSLEYTVVSSLLMQPASKDLKCAIPEGTVLNSVSVLNGVCYIDLSREFVENAVHTKEREAITLYSVVNTVTELPLINSVKFFIDGETGYGFLHYDISEALTNRSDLFELQ